MSDLRGGLSASGALAGRLTGGGTLAGRIGGGAGGAAYQIGDGLKVVEGVLMVDAAQAVEQDNTRPVTSAAVYTEIGNIEALLAAL